MSALLRAVVAPLAAALYPQEPFATSLDHHHSFTVEYRCAALHDPTDAVAHRPPLRRPLLHRCSTQQQPACSAARAQSVA